jgi:hypothetical protein
VFLLTSGCQAKACVAQLRCNSQTLAEGKFAPQYSSYPQSFYNGSQHKGRPTYEDSRIPGSPRDATALQVNHTSSRHPPWHDTAAQPPCDVRTGKAGALSDAHGRLGAHNGTFAFTSISEGQHGLWTLMLGGKMDASPITGVP